MTLVDRKRLTRGRRTHRGARPRRQPAPGTRDLEGTGARDLEGTGARGAVAAPAGHPQAQARQATRGEPKPAPEREPPAFGVLVLVGAIFGLAVLKEFGRIGGPVVVKVKSVPRPPASFWIVGGVGTLGRIGARVLGR